MRNLNGQEDDSFPIQICQTWHQTGGTLQCSKKFLVRNSYYECQTNAELLKEISLVAWNAAGP